MPGPTQDEVAAVLRLRGLILELLYTRHKEQGSHMDHIMLCTLLGMVGFGAGERDVLTALQDLAERGYVTFEQKKDFWTGRVRIEHIGILPKGRDLCDHVGRDDPAVLVR